MRFSLKALAGAFGLLWGGALLVVGLLNLASPSYGSGFLQMASSVYPGFRVNRTFVDVLIGAGYGLVDGFVGGLVLGWLYNIFARGVERG